MFRSSFAARTAALAAALALIPASYVLPVEAQTKAAANREITITVTRVKPLDKADELSDGDFFARATIDGVPSVIEKPTSVKGAFKPNWKLSHKVADGTIKVKLELIDKDVTADDPVDINKVTNKRDLDFTVNTKTCKIEGFSQTYKCGSVISRTGTETKKAEISFTVSVKKAK